MTPRHCRNRYTGLERLANDPPLRLQTEHGGGAYSRRSNAKLTLTIMSIYAPWTRASRRRQNLGLHTSNVQAALGAGVRLDKARSMFFASSYVIRSGAILPRKLMQR